ncbi:ComEC/Rec2 family competence protein, partial [Kineococcus glutinatus]|uniref:ComEC/Rec2 family competence protein n=1 Tax=Kineococcus glutinatus TaxID=1070872 RepID=UPI0031ECEBD6
PQRRGGAGPVQAVAERVLTALREVVAQRPADQRGLLPALVVGDTSAMPAALEADMRATGLAHLTAVSGSNTTLVCGAALMLARGIGLGRRTRLLLAGAVLAGFVVLARPEPSVLRAAAMGAVGLLGLLGGRPGRGLPPLLAAVVALLVVDPWLGRQYGFALSVLATGGLLVLAAPWARWLRARGVPGWLAAAVAVPAAAQAVCGPVAAMLQPGVNLLAVAVNVVVAPAVAPATVLGLLAALASPAS